MVSFPCPAVLAELVQQIVDLVLSVILVKKPMALVALSSSVSAFKSSAGAAARVFATGGATVLAAGGAAVLALGAGAAAGVGCGVAGAAGLAAGCGAPGWVATAWRSGPGVSGLTRAQPAVRSNSRTTA